MSLPHPADRPRERLARLGPTALRDDELLALLLGAGQRGLSVIEVATSLLVSGGVGGLTTLSRRSPQALSRIEGVGNARAGRLVAAFELGRRIASREAPGRAARSRIQGPEDAVSILKPDLEALDQEEFHALLLDRQHRVLQRLQITRGILDASLVHPREVFRRAVEAGAAAVIVAHNHPSGDPTPSAEDREVTRQLAAAGRTLGIPLLDHVVIGREGWRAMSREGGLE